MYFNNNLYLKNISNLITLTQAILNENRCLLKYNRHSLKFSVFFCRFELSLLDTIQLPETPSSPYPFKKLPDLHPLGCGFEHAAVIRNNNVYTMGVSTSGCLGLGPLLTQSSPARLIQTLSELKVKVLSVSCGKKHTLALTDFGVSIFFIKNIYILFTFIIINEFKIKKYLEENTQK